MKNFTVDTKTLMKDPVVPLIIKWAIQRTSEVAYAIIGKDSEDIVQKALSYGTAPHFVSGMIELNKDWK